MKILHLADLHIGKIIYEQSLLEDQKYILDEIIKIIKKEKIEIVLIAGDIYDRSIPPLDAVNLLNNFLNILIEKLKLKVFIISGNHDSKERLNFGSEIFKNNGLFIQTEYTGKIEKVILKDEFGPLNIYMLPYIKPIEIKNFFKNEKIETYNDAIKLIINNEKINEKERNILIAHQFVTSGTDTPERSDSEILYLGGTENVDSSNFDKFDYVALGHIHRPQKIGKDTIRYAGTMLKYSFSEINHNKSLVIIDINEKNNLKFKLKELEPLRDMREIRGPLEELVKYENYEGTNTDDYIRAIITNEEPVYEPMEQIRKIYPNTLSLEILNSKSFVEGKDLEKIEKLKEKSEIELFDNFYEFQNNIKLNDEQIEILNNIIDDSRKDE